MTLVLAVSQFQIPAGSLNSGKKKEKIFVNFALNMEKITKVFKVRKLNKKERSLLLFNLSKNSFAIQLKNSNIFPVFAIEQIIEYPVEILPLDGFIKGCFYNPIFEGFVIIEGKVYGIPDEIFLSGK